MVEEKSRVIDSVLGTFHLGTFKPFAVSNNSLVSDPSEQDTTVIGAPEQNDTLLNDDVFHTVKKKPHRPSVIPGIVLSSFFLL